MRRVCALARWFNWGGGGGRGAGSCVRSYLADAASWDVVVGGGYHEDGLGVPHAILDELAIGDAAGEDGDLLVVDDLWEELVQLGDVAAVGVDLVLWVLEKVLDQGSATVSSGSKDGVGRHGVETILKGRKVRFETWLPFALLFIWLGRVMKLGVHGRCSHCSHGSHQNVNSGLER